MPSAILDPLVLSILAVESALLEGTQLEGETGPQFLEPGPFAIIIEPIPATPSFATVLP